MNRDPPWKLYSCSPDQRNHNNTAFFLSFFFRSFCLFLYVWLLFFLCILHSWKRKPESPTTLLWIVSYFIHPFFEISCCVEWPYSWNFLSARGERNEHCAWYLTFTWTHHITMPAIVVLLFPLPPSITRIPPGSHPHTRESRPNFSLSVKYVT